MKIRMKPHHHDEEKAGAPNSSGANSNKIRIAVFGQHDVGKSALTVRFLTRRYIGEYKSNTDLLYRQTLAMSGGHSLDIEIVDISTSSDSGNAGERKTFPVEELQRADGFIIVYSITDRSSFSTAIQALADIHAATAPPTITPTNPSRVSPPIALIGNKRDLEHLRVVEKSEGASVCGQYEGCSFYECSVAENSPEVYSSFQSIISSLASTVPTPKRKFSVTKIFGNLRLGRNSASFPIPMSPASIVDTNVVTNEGLATSTISTSSPEVSRESSPGLDDVNASKSKKLGNCSSKHERQSSSDSSSSSSSSSNFSICHLKSKLHSIKIRQNSPPICSL